MCTRLKRIASVSLMCWGFASHTFAQQPGNDLQVAGSSASRRVTNTDVLGNYLVSLFIARLVHENGHVVSTGGHLSLSLLDLFNPLDLIQAGSNHKVFGSLIAKPADTIGAAIGVHLSQFKETSDVFATEYSPFITTFFHGVSQTHVAPVYPVTWPELEAGRIPWVDLAQNTFYPNDHVVTLQNKTPGKISLDETLEAKKRFLALNSQLQRPLLEAQRRYLLDSTTGGVLMTRGVYNLLKPIQTTQRLNQGKREKAFVATLGLATRGDLQVQLLADWLGISRFLYGNSKEKIPDPATASYKTVVAGHNDIRDIALLSKWSYPTVAALTIADFAFNRDEFQYLWDLSRGREGKIPATLDRPRFSFNGADVMVTYQSQKIDISKSSLNSFVRMFKPPTPAKSGRLFFDVGKDPSRLEQTITPEESDHLLKTRDIVMTVPSSISDLHKIGDHFQIQFLGEKSQGLNNTRLYFEKKGRSWEAFTNDRKKIRVHMKEQKDTLEIKLPTAEIKKVLDVFGSSHLTTVIVQNAFLPDFSPHPSPVVPELQDPSSKENLLLSPAHAVISSTPPDVYQNPLSQSQPHRTLSKDSSLEKALHS